MPDPSPRRPGGQPGNTNALKHGFYARRIPGIKDAAIEALQTEFPGFEEEIFALRIYARHLLENSAECNTFAESVLVTRTLCLCFSTLARLHREHRAYTEKPIETQAALRRAAPDVTDVKPPATSYDDFADNLAAHFPNRSHEEVLHSTDAIPIGTFDPHLPDLPPNLGFPPDHPVTIAATPDLEKLASRIATLAQIAPYYKIEIPAPTKPIDIAFKNAARVRAILGETSQAIAAGILPTPELLANPQSARPVYAPETDPTWLPSAAALPASASHCAQPAPTNTASPTLPGFSPPAPPSASHCEEPAPANAIGPHPANLPPAGPLRIGPQTTSSQTPTPGASIPPVPPPADDNWFADLTVEAVTATLAEERPSLYAAFSTDPTALAILNAIQDLSNAAALADREALLAIPARPPAPRPKQPLPPVPGDKDDQPPPLTHHYPKDGLNGRHHF